MALALGTRLGAYEIVNAIGAGGMGEVYRATDTALGRHVAIKVLPESVATDPDRLARFEREARTLAALNHPNIAQIYGLERSGTTPALVMELVEGETLADRIARGPIPIDEALSIAKQIAEALETAHEQGIIHRDLKPANIKVRADGTVKVLDFGLAKLAESTGAPNLSMSPTITSPAMATGIGVLLGTAAYMSPEQARGKAADKRSDIWAFGCVLYEMLTGKRPFEGEDVTDTIANALKIDPDWSALPSEVPPPIRTLLQSCLLKDRRHRVAEISTALFVLEKGPTLSPPPSQEIVSDAQTDVAISEMRRVLARSNRRRITLAVTAALLTGAVAASAVWYAITKRLPPPPIRLEVGLGTDASLAINGGVGSGASSIISPDGQMLAFVGQKDRRSQLYIRRLDQLEARPLSGSDDASNPFFSPDGQWIAFFAGGKLKKISVTGGAALALCDAPNPRGGVWPDADTIVFQPTGGLQDSSALMRVSSAGGKPEALTTLAQGEVTQRWPQVLPGGKAVLFTSSGITGNYENANIVVQPLPNGPRKILQRGAYYGRYLRSGHLVYIHDATLFAAPFDLDRLDLTGQPVPAIEGVTSAVGNGGAQFAVSDTGTLVYLPGQNTDDGGWSIFWMDRTGKTTTLRATPANWSNPDFAPDGGRLAMDILDGKQTDVWVYEWARDTLSRLTFDPTNDGKPIWTPDGRRLTFSSMRADKSTMNLYWQRADGTGEVQRLTDSKSRQYAGSWDPSGKFLAFTELSPQTSDDLMILPIAGDEASGWKPGKPTVFLNGPFNEREPMFSPDGRWLAYFSNESGRYEVYVRPFPGPGGKWQISSGGGDLPVWSRTRHELLYRAPNQTIMVASYTVEGDSLRAEKPRQWSEGRLTPTPRERVFDLHPDGQRLALAAGVPDAQTTTLQNKVVFIFNFFDELRRISPVK